MPDLLGTTRPPGAQVWRWEWQLAAHCRGRDDLFFHPHGEREPMRSERDSAARQVCAACPVRRECLAHAIESQEPYGLWGGKSEAEREVLVHGPRPMRRR